MNYCKQEVTTTLQIPHTYIYTYIHSYMYFVPTLEIRRENTYKHTYILTQIHLYTYIYIYAKLPYLAY
jgi:hypothetical protein